MYLRGLVSWSRMPGCPSYKKIMKCLGDRNEETENHTDKSKGVGNGIQKIQDSSCINGTLLSMFGRTRFVSSQFHTK